MFRPGTCLWVSILGGLPILGGIICQEWFGLWAWLPVVIVIVVDRGGLDRLQILTDLLRRLLDLFASIEILLIAGPYVDLVLRVEVHRVLICWNLVWDVLRTRHSRLIGPAARHVAQRVATTANQNHGHSEALHVLDALPMPPDRQVEQADTIAAKRVCTALQHNRLRLEALHDGVHHWLEGQLIRLIVDSIVHREVNCVVFTDLGSDIVKTTCAREVVTILMERDSHDPISRQKGLLNTVAMMAVNVDVEHSLVRL